MNPTPAPPAIGTAVVDLLRTQRQTVSSLLLGVGGVLLILAVWLGYKAMQPGAPPAETPPAETNPLEPKDAKPAEVANPKRGDYLIGGLAALAGFLVLASAGSVLMVALPKPGEEQQRADARMMLLAVGGAVGLILILAGVAFLYRWSESLTAWLDKERGETKQAWKVLVPVLMVTLGAAVTFLSILPARADERNSTAVRRTVYGANLGLTVLLLVTALVIGNVVVSMRMPNKLDVTAAAISSISQPTEQLLARLAEPVTVYHISAENDRVTNDTRALLDRMADVNPSKFKIVPVSPITDKMKFKDLSTKYPPVGQFGLGVLLATGQDEKRHAFIREDELSIDEPGEGGQRRKVFLGESKIARELSFLGESGTKTVVYVTQGGGELSLGGGGEPAPPDRSMSTLRAYLEKSNLEVKPLTFDPAAPSVPADAGLVLVPDPTAPFPAPVAAALDKYMSEPRGDKKGKLLLLSGARNGPDGKIAKTGLESLVAKFGVTLQDKVLMSERMDPLDWYDTFAVPGAAAVSAGNPIAALYRQGIGPWTNCRPLGASQLPPGGPIQLTPLFGSIPQRSSWLEDGIPTDLRKTVEEVYSSSEVRRRKGFTNSSRLLGALVTENPPPPPPGQPRGEPVPRLAVYGVGDFVSDASVRTRGTETHPHVELIGATADWLRERGAVAAGAGAKTYATYKLSPTADDTRLVLFPLGLALLIVVGLGAGVWVIRRS